MYDTVGFEFVNQITFFQLVKTDKNGKKIWSKIVDTPYKDTAPAITGKYSDPFLFSNGDIGISYNFERSPIVNPPYGKCWESILIRIDTSGQLKSYHIINPMFPDTGADPSIGIRRIASVHSIVPTPDNCAYAMMTYGILGKDTLSAVKNRFHRKSGMDAENFSHQGKPSSQMTSLSPNCLQVCTSSNSQNIF